MFAPCFEISSTRAALDFENFLFVIQEQRGFSDIIHEDGVLEFSR
jgi:hypothetical protein